MLVEVSGWGNLVFVACQFIRRILIEKREFVSICPCYLYVEVLFNPCMC